MMDWTDIAAIVFACTTVNHLGLVSAAEKLFKHRLYIIDCPRCFTFWSVMAYCLAHLLADKTGLSGDGIAAIPSYLPKMVAISLLCAYFAIWLELIEGLIDKLYNDVYKKIYPTADTTTDDATSA